ncbi:hypothetical protein [Scleromatobacter humisilvae]|uniref:Uncharacterized protein n=1 Tax=Scleromatobacter humisilvae TaxID=2897159 RepID=A0A9X2C2C2_9BURK|nr:hypothetical protein [Scleromatobacter humisilvae]MCK9686674.1 hypothetical protein [Scleromatobacter humisilvae]
MTSTRASSHIASCAARRARVNMRALAIVIAKTASTMHTVVMPLRSPGLGRS